MANSLKCETVVPILQIEKIAVSTVDVSVRFAFIPEHQWQKREGFLSISTARRRKTPLTFLMADADNFKEINTRFGHLTGDFVLAEIAGILKASIRGSDAALRYGGDEFLILLSDTTATGAERVVARIRGKLDDWNAAGNLEDLRVSVSIGIAEWRDGQALDEMLDSADHRMYEQKNYSKTTH